MYIVGIDPGKDGAICLMNRDGEVLHIVDMPMVVEKLKNGKPKKGAKPTLDLDKVYDLLQRWRMAYGFLRVWLEKIRYQPQRTAGGERRGGAAGKFAQAKLCGQLEGLLCGLQLYHKLVTPLKWQNDRLAGIVGADTKERSVNRVQAEGDAKLLLKTSRCRKPSSDRADAINIARYGLSQTVK